MLVAERGWSPTTVERLMQQTIKTASLNVALKLEKIKLEKLEQLTENLFETIASGNHRLSSDFFLFFAGSSQPYLDICYWENRKE